MEIKHYSESFQREYEQAFSSMRTEPAKALKMIDRLLVEAVSHNDLERMAELYYGAGNASFMLSDSRTSMDYLEKAVRYYKKLDQPEKAGRALSFLGLLQLHQGDFADSIETFTGVMETAKSINDDTSMYKAYSQLGQCYTIIEDFDDARSCFERAHLILRSDAGVYSSTESVPIFYSGYIETCVSLGDFDMAEALIREKDGIISDYPRFMGSPFDIWPRYYLEYTTMDRVSEPLSQAMWNACTDEKYRSAEYYIILTQFLGCEYEQKHYEHAIELGELMLHLMEHSDLDRRKMAVSRIIILCHEALGQQDAMRQETIRYFTYEERAARYTNYSLISYLHVRQENRLLLDEAKTDELTGLYNRRALNEAVTEMYEAAYHGQQMFGYEMLDIDLFKQINDRYGHVAGDRALKVIGSVLAGHAGNGVFPARYGGDEFTIIYQNHTRKEILGIAQEIRREIRERVEAGECMPMTVSQGIFCVIPHPYLKEWQYHANADKALYQSKLSRTGAIHLNTEEEEIVIE